MALTLPQQLIAQNPARFRVAACGRRFGKTFLARNQIAKFSSQPNQRVWYIAPSYRMAKQILWQSLKKKLIEINWVKRVNESDLSIRLVNDSEIALKGADNYDSLRGVGLNFVIFDECADIDPEAWFEVIRPTLSDTNGHALFLGTPKGTNWFKDLWDRSTTDSRWASFQYTTLAGGRVPEEEIEMAKQDLDARTFRQEYEATFETFSGRVAYAFLRQIHLQQPDHLNTRTIHVGLDFNVDPMCAVVLIQDKDILYGIDEIHLRNSNTNELAVELQTRYPRSEIIVYPDPSGASRRTSAGSQTTDHTILRNSGFQVRAPRAHTAVRDRINALNSRLMNNQGIAKLFFDPKLKYCIESLEKYCYKDGTSIPDKGQYDHMFDALSYCVDYLFPIKRDIPEEAPQRWGHRI